MQQSPSFLASSPQFFSTSSPVALSGELFKKAVQSPLAGWQKRFFETEGAYLKYYGHEKQKLQLSPPLAAIDLRQLREVTLVGKKKRRIELTLTTNRTIQLKAKDEEEARRWFDCIMARRAALRESSKIGRAVQQECRDRSRMPSSA
eukprot:TRINITY_DN11277_c0_g1_i2.p1 TRINITY_DN11277_c0_g1~~TRINITY_DN11277_c0_g1_i2.p1  ORF type:complete len:147 (+),score=25.98 TRINITY_DN11277_c0_g1_i2:114-554(+)